MLRRLAHAPALAFVLALGACEPAPEPLPTAVDRTQELDTLVETGERALAEERYAIASGYFEDVLRRDPDHARARLDLAEALLGLDNAAAARDNFALVANDPGMRKQALQGIGIAALQLGEVEVARGVLLEVTAEDPALWRAWNALGVAHDLSQEREPARAAYGKALEHAPEPEIVLNNQGFSRLAAGDYDGARAAFEAALALRPDLTAARTNLQLCLGFQNQYTDLIARADAQELPRLLNNLGYVALLKGDLPRAESYFARALEASPSFYPSAWRNLQVVARMRSQGEEAPG
jgi:Tfp pilus assembly protein PilF